jgi:alcohol dehydrogenase
VANVGVHGKPVMLEMDRLWIQNINISMGLVNTNTLGMLLKLVTSQKLQVEKFVTHHFAMDDMVAAYETFGNAAETGALKVLIGRTT